MQILEGCFVLYEMRFKRYYIKRYYSFKMCCINNCVNLFEEKFKFEHLHFLNLVWGTVCRGVSV